MTPYAGTTSKYLQSGVVVLGICGVAAIYLNFEGVKCLTELSKDNDDIESLQTLEDSAADCFVITNSYVYSLFGVVAGLLLVAVWAFRRKRDSSPG